MDVKDTQYFSILLYMAAHRFVRIIYEGQSINNESEAISQKLFNKNQKYCP